MIALRLDPINRIAETVTEFKDLQNAESSVSNVHSTVRAPA
jgi:hypothetical protein